MPASYGATMAAACFVLGAFTASASDTFIVSGTIMSVTDNIISIELEWKPGDPIRVEVHFDPTAQDENPSAAVGSYDLTGMNFPGLIHQFVGAEPTCPVGQIEVKNDDPYMGDVVSFRSEPCTAHRTYPWGSRGAALGDTLMTLVDHTASALASDELPDTINLAAFQDRMLYVFDHSATAVVQSVERVPEPAGCGAVALLALVGMARRRRVLRALRRGAVSAHAEAPGGSAARDASSRAIARLRRRCLRRVDREGQQHERGALALGQQRIDPQRFVERTRPRHIRNSRTVAVGPFPAPTDTTTPATAFARSSCAPRR